MSSGVSDRPAGRELSDWSVLDHVPLAVVITGLDARVQYVNGAAERLYGHSREALRDASVLTSLVRPVDLTAAMDIMSTVVSGRTWSGEFDVPRPDGATVRVHVDESPIWRDNRVVGIIGVGQAVSDPAARASATMLDGIAQVTAQLAGADDETTIAHLVVDRAADVFGADVASLSLLDADGVLVLEALRGGAPHSRERFARYAADANSPVGDAVSRNEMIIISGSAEMQRRYPSMPPAARGERTVIAVPLTFAGRRLGGFSLSFAGRPTFSPTDTLFLRALADAASQALSRVTAAAAAADRARKLAMLGEASVELASSLDYQTTLAHVAELALQELADWVGVELLDGDALRPVVTLHRDPHMIELAEELRRRYPTPLDAPSGVPAVVRTGESALYEHIPEETIVAGAVDEHHLALIRQLNLVSAMIVPLPVRDRILGALVLISSDPRRIYGPEDLAFAEELARRAAVAIDNSQLYSQTREASVRLQHALLPESLPDPDGWDLAVHYRPAGRTEIGGDFYDAIELPGGRLITVVGDVMGRGVNAAAAMAQLRASLRAYLAVDADPVAALTALTTMFGVYRMGGLATVLVALNDPESATVTFSGAGHLPPVVRRADGTVAVVPLPACPPLGPFARSRSPRRAVSLPLASGDTYLMFTDGLVETREQDIDRGIDRLVDALEQGCELGSEARLRALAARLVPPGQDDDVTVLAVHRS